ncbi:acyl-CoA thioesterase [Thermodesulfobacteriota bacterium]
MLMSARLGQNLSIDDIGELKLRVWPGDIDFYPEMNNGRQLSLMDLGRIDFAIRTGLMRIAHQKGWGFVAAGSSVRYRHRLRPFRQFVLRTRLVGHDSRWFYFHQQMVRNQKVCTSALIRGGLTSKSGLVLAQKVLGVMNLKDWHPELPGWVNAWIEADELRPDS